MFEDTMTQMRIEEKRHYSPQDEFNAIVVISKPYQYGPTPGQFLVHGRHRRKEKETTDVSLFAKESRWVCRRMLDDDAELILAKRLKKSWIEDHKIRTKWKAQKKRDGLTNQTSAPLTVEGVSNHRHDETNADSESDTPPNRPDKSPTPTPPHDKQSLRDLRRIAYASKLPHTQKADSSLPKRVPRRSHNDRGGKATVPVGRETGQPDMKLRMNVLLERIKRDFS